MGNGYDTAQICLNGHVVNDAVHEYPEHNKKFCDRCGKATLTACPDCNASLQGALHSEGGVFRMGDIAPAFCHNCGKPYPWTGDRLKAARDLADELEALDAQEKALMKETVEDLVSDGPTTQLAATRFKRLLAKAGPAAAQAFKNVLVEVVSETAKKIVWPT